LDQDCCTSEKHAYRAIAAFVILEFICAFVAFILCTLSCLSMRGRFNNRIPHHSFRGLSALFHVLAALFLVIAWAIFIAAVRGSLQDCSSKSWDDDTKYPGFGIAIVLTVLHFVAAAAAVALLHPEHTMI
jgi:uncharacterized membrane protein YbhN (UPF0104 family)